MSYIHGDGCIHLSDYMEPNKKHEKHVIELMEKLGELFTEVEDISKELRYYSLYLDWGDGKLNHGFAKLKKEIITEIIQVEEQHGVKLDYWVKTYKELIKEREQG